MFGFPLIVRRLTQQRDGIMVSAMEENLPRRKTINQLLSSVSPDLQGLNAWRYQRQISSGIQELMEALSFEHYLQVQFLITMEEAQAKLSEGIVLTEDDYVLGLFDLVGELMRFAITGMATNGKLLNGGSFSDVGDETRAHADKRRDILMDLRMLRTYFETLDTTSSTANGSALGRDV